MTRAGTTSFSDIYQCFLSKITDDMYMELTEKETKEMLEELLVSSIPKFEFPRFDIFNYVLGAEVEDIMQDEEGNIITTSTYIAGYFNTILTAEEINILATYMIVEWIGQQLASIENIRMKYSGTDFKFTSQANHMQKLLVIKKDYEREGFHLQRLYKRRIVDKYGIPRSTFGDIMNIPNKIYEEQDSDAYLDSI